MKIYVDKMPKDCWDCPCHKSDNGQCKLSREYTDYRPADCPLQSLAEHDAEIRKQERLKVIDEVEQLVEEDKGTLHNYWVVSYVNMLCILDKISNGGER